MKARRAAPVQTSAVKWHFLQPKMRQELTTHLGKIDKLNVDLALWGIDLMCSAAKNWKNTPMREIRKNGMRYKAVVRHTDKLVRLLKEISDNRFAPSRFVEMLVYLSRRAADRSLVYEIEPGRGRKPIEWRDDLIEIVYRCYPSGSVVKSDGSHFEETIEMILGYIDKEVSDVHSVVMDALRRSCID